jgi:RHS repeat-associated protein
MRRINTTICRGQHISIDLQRTSNAPYLPNYLRNMKSIALFITAFAASVAGFMPAQAQTPSTLSISKPNGYATTVADDFKHKTVLGAVRWTRVWDGYEWKFNPHWESLSTSWGNLTGSQSANTTVGDIPVSAGTTLTGVDKPPSNLLIGRSTSTTTGSSGGSGGGCWAWVDEDWQPTYSSEKMFFDPEDPAVTMEREAGPMIPLRSTPFNRGIQGEAVAGTPANTDYIASKSVSIDFATLCPGGSDTGSSAVQEFEGIRRSNELYVGTSGRYAFNNRSVLEKRAVKQLAIAATATQYANIASGQLAASIIGSPVANAKGYRWIDKSGDWTDYNTQGQVVAFGDKNNNIIWLLRDTDGLLIAVIDGNPASAGKVLYSLHYSGQLVTQVKDYSGSASTSIDQANRSISYQYDDKNRLTQVTDTRGGITAYTYDARNRIIKITDPENRIEKFGYIGDTTRRRTAPDGGVSDFVFEYDDVNKQFTSKISGPETAAGRTSEIYTHNRVGKLVGQTLNGRAELHIKYDTGSRSEVRTNARGFGTRLTKNEFEQLVLVDQADGTSSSKTYSAQHLGLTQETDELGIVTQYQYDAKGNLTQKKQATGTSDERITNYVVNSQGQATSITRKGRTETNTTGGTATVTPDATWQLEYDSLGQVKKTIDPEGNTRQYAYDRDGNLRKYTDPRGNSTSYEVDAAGNLTKSTDALGQIQTYQYDKVGNLTQVTDARAKVSQAAFDAMNRSTKIVNAVGGQFQVQYNAQGMPITEIDEDGRTSRAEFDNFLRITKQLDGLGNATDYSYSIPDGTANGIVGSLFDPTEIKYPTFTQRQRYDQLERLTSDTLLNPNTLGIEGLVSGTQYDKRGQIKSELDANGKTRFYTWNALKQLIETTDSLGNKTKASYDVRGNLIELVDAKNNVNKFEYDKNNRIVKDILPLGQTTVYTYDEVGNLKDRTDANGQKTSYTFNSVNRPSQVKQYKVGGTLARTTSYTWDASDNLTNWSDTDHSRPTGQQTSTGTISYDDAGRKLSESVSYPNPQGTNTALSYSYQYSPAGNKTQLTWPDATKIDYSYSLHNELQSVAIPGEGSISVSQYKWLAPAKVTLPGGTAQERTLDGLLNLEGLKVKTPGQQTVLSLANTYGKVQELKTNARVDTAANISTSKTSTYTYDDEIRLTQVKTDAGGMFGSDTEAFTLDAVGNRVAHSKISGAWTYDGNNRLTQRGTGTCGSGSTTCYQYDELGNQTQKTEAGKVTQYSYDTQNRLVEVADITAGQSATQRKTIAKYGYDPLDRRIWKEQYADVNAVALTQAKRTTYLYAVEGLIAEATQNIIVVTDASGVQTVTASAAPQITTQYGPRPDSEFTTGLLFIKTKNTNNTDTFAYFHHDHLQTPLQATDKAGNIVWAARFDAFGKASIITPAATALIPTIESNLRLPGQYEDQETGLHYNYRRYYDTQIGRYITQDPIGVEGGINQYKYAQADPVNLSDATGECPMCAAYAMCVASCMLEDAATNAITNQCNNLGDSAKGCAASCLMGPLGRLGKWMGRAKPTVCAINSFPSDTLVHVKPKNAKAANAHQGKADLKPISQLKVGDEVLALSEWKTKGSKAKTDQRLSYEKVTDIFSSHKEQNLIHLTLDNGETLTATEGHPFKTTEGWRDAVMLKKGGKLLLKGGDEASDDADKAVTITDIRTEIKVLPVFNLEVANAHTFFVGKAGELVHNGFGSYTCNFASGKKYHGKGDKKRSEKSGKEHSDKNNDPLESIDWTPANNNRDSFRDEHDRMMTDKGGHKNPNNYNNRGSPGGGKYR